jgi:multiple antibiotic resistance protein
MNRFCLFFQSFAWCPAALWIRQLHAINDEGQRGSYMATTAELINAFTTLLVTTDPPGLAPIFLGLTAGMNAAQRKQTALRGTLIAFIILAVFAVTGAGVLGLLGISLPAFRIAGGFLLFFIAFEMIFEKRQERKEKTSELAITKDHIQNLAVFPLAIPLISGPGSISATILLAGNFPTFLQRVQLIAVIAVVFVIILAALVIADRIDRYLGQTGRAILTRLLGVLLAALAVQFVIDGVRASMTVYTGP